MGIVVIQTEASLLKRRVRILGRLGWDDHGNGVSSLGPGKIIYSTCYKLTCISRNPFKRSVDMNDSLSRSTGQIPALVLSNESSQVTGLIIRDIEDGQPSSSGQVSPVEEVAGPFNSLFSTDRPPHSKYDSLVRGSDRIRPSSGPRPFQTRVSSWPDPFSALDLEQDRKKGRSRLALSSIESRSTESLRDKVSKEPVQRPLRPLWDIDVQR